ncbi:B12-binding domain-containing radical SAM protein [Amycolatopsis sp. NBC_00345]|uniref:B12-binding domain-containing radical SAM protein n=1 Tax=Amycolatopsis sp. NBC_00345 TaxID=2975955 RepID=UPI002E25656B
MSRICLLVPTNDFDRYFVQVPLDVVYAAGQLRAEGHEVTVWDTRFATVPPADAQDLVVVFTAIADRAQCYPLELGPVRDAVTQARTRYPGARFVAVGPHVNHLPWATLDELGVDTVARGEADSAAVFAARDLAVSGRVLPSGRSADLLAPAADLPSYPVIPLETMAHPAFDLFPMSQYTSEVIDQGLPMPGPCGMVLAARGCTYGCTFCHLPFGTRMRMRPTDRVMAEIDAQQSAGLDALFFLDYVFGINPSFYGELCTRLTGRGLTWLGQTRAEVVLRSDVGAWAAAGCRGMWLGAESPSVAGTGVHKRVSAEQIEGAVAKLRDAGIVPFAFLLMGLPDDEASISGRIVDWAAQLPAWFGLNQLFLRPGTKLYDQLAAEYGGGRLPTTWPEVEAVTSTYRSRYPADLDAQEKALRALPNFLGNALTAAK